MINELRDCNENNAIPDEVLTSICWVYEIGKKEDIAKLPNNLICLRNGDFWTTWDKVIEKRERIQGGRAHKACTRPPLGVGKRARLGNLLVSLGNRIAQSARK